ncbi:MAG: ATP-binding cassette domain-containing protein [Pseudolabrys sp.]
MDYCQGADSSDSRARSSGMALASVAIPFERKPGRGCDPNPVLSIQGLQVMFASRAGLVKAVDGVSFDVQRGEVVALVGESGCGKSASSLAVMRLLPKRGVRAQGRVLLDGRDLLSYSEREMQRIRGHQISMIFQEPMTSLNPTLTIGLQLTEPLVAHLRMSKREARKRAVELLKDVQLTEPELRLKQYPARIVRRHAPTGNDCDRYCL